jgi:hypothetical protein
MCDNTEEDVEAWASTDSGKNVVSAVDPRIPAWGTGGRGG